MDTNGDSLISYAEAEATLSLFLPANNNITDMTGIGAFVNLDSLSCVATFVTSLDVSNNPNLKYLDCNGGGGYSNPLSTLNVSNNPALTYLSCWGNSLINLDVTKCTALTVLQCSSNYNLTSLDVSNNTALKELYCSSNQLTSLDVSNNTSLTYLGIWSMPMLEEVCVWESFPAGVEVNANGSPLVKYTTECGSIADLIYKHIRFGSTSDPLNGLTITWASGGPADSIAWGYTTNLEEGVCPGLKREGAFGISMFDYTFPSLKAAATIHYAILDSKDNTWTEERTFNTASDASNDQYSFTVLGDSRTYPDQWKIISEAVLETDFTLFLGDIVSDGGSMWDWYAWFDYGENFIAREPVYHTIGNHDVDNPSTLAGYKNYSSLFTLPGNELYYSFTYGNAVFICLNSMEAENSEQYSWLLSTLEANKDQTWKFVFFHSPFYTSPTHVGEMDPYFNTWWKAFDDYGVDMIFNGHTHNYQRTKPINRKISTTSPVASYGSGIGMGRCQVVAGSVGPLTGAAADPGLWWLEKSERKRHFCNIDINRGMLTFKAMDANQDVFDSLVIDKSHDHGTGTSDLRSTGSWIYPNPTYDLLTIETTNPESQTIEIHSLNGQLLFRNKTEEPTIRIDLSTFQKGLYFITVRSRDFVRTEKIIKL